jgi:hypothetical protein
MKTLVIALIVTCVAITGILLFFEIPKTSTSAVIQLSATAEASPNDVKIHTLQQLSSIDDNVTILDNSTLDQVPVLKNAIDQAFGKFAPLSSDQHTFTTQISQTDVNSILHLAGSNVNQLPETQTNDANFGVNFTTYTSAMDFKLDNLYYHVIIEQLVPSQGEQPEDNMS